MRRVLAASGKKPPYRAVAAIHVAAWLTLFFTCVPTHSYAEGPLAKADVPWNEIAQRASEFVARESGPDIFPFRQSDQKSAKLALIHYFPFWVLSFDNKPTELGLLEPEL